MKKYLMCLAITSLAALITLAADTATNSAAVRPATPESFQIRNQKYGDLLRPKDANNANGTPIVLYPATPWKCLTWKLHPIGESEFQLQNHLTSKTFAVSEKSGGKPSAVVQVPFVAGKEGPTWRFKRLDDGSYQITDVKSGEALTADDSGGSVKVVVAPWREKSEQKWELQKIDPQKLTM